ncbi:MULTISPECIES: flippase [unclassified Citrobacter]|uniref:flippase n=1 Tax=Citrobacter TaxID=544 RepID=UPI002578A2D3|nr:MULTISPECIES: flippase [unclassified Citrobacter]MDM2754180.1 flippase [Citrobacter sp. Cpo221]MDM2786856.1 flippase [Citrobacter sp. Cpo113]MDM2839324.1 flippase [Citrobacter sp. Cpo086]MDQ2229262.1 flippase [Citrobacter portucalensis]
MSIIKNSIWNVAGYIVPAIITIPALGLLGRVLGAEMFGIFTLALAIVGYASIFDVGLTRAVIREISIFRDELEEKKKIISTASLLVIIMGVIATLVLYFFSDTVTDLLKISPALHQHVVNSLKILALSIPIFLVTQIWLAILEGEERFGILNIYKSITGSLLSLLPVVFIYIHPTLEFAIIGLVISRLFCLVFAFFLCKNIIIQSKLFFSGSTLKRLLMFGGWITVSNIISPLMAYFDRFIVSNQLGAAVVAFYTAPSEAVARLGIIPGAFARAIFPRLSSSTNAIERRRSKKIVTLLLLLITLPLLLIGLVAGNWMMTLWMGPAFAGLSAMVLSILLVGFVLNSLAQVPFASIQSRGFARITAYIHLFELVPYLAMLFYLIKNHGIIGAAIAWTIRMGVDYLLLSLIDRKLDR